MPVEIELDSVVRTPVLWRGAVTRKDVVLPVSFSSEFRQRVVELVRSSDKPLPEVAKELGVSRSGLQNWVRQAKAEVGEGSAGLTSAEHKELAELRRRNGQLETENEVLKRAAAYVGDVCQVPVVSSRSMSPSKIFLRASWPLRSRRRVGLGGWAGTGWW